jgi:hypothetical protein
MSWCVMNRLLERQSIHVAVFDVKGSGNKAGGNAVDTGSNGNKANAVSASRHNNGKAATTNRKPRELSLIFFA